jgi:hypothetical protein
VVQGTDCELCERYIILQKKSILNTDKLLEITFCLAKLTLFNADLIQSTDDKFEHFLIPDSSILMFYLFAIGNILLF